ncbi:protein transport protein SEC9-like [Diaphorina citri]|uniref:Protein transport protein SEC9-like n=1 Tax=Diaphorina citri TaxID=121845 RepID=A0A1S3DDA1_DIACI|nr:protein transport protein SEC9-like [Diaphorina citri]
MQQGGNTCAREPTTCCAPPPKLKRKARGPKVTNQMVEDQLNRMANCYETKRQERIARIPLEVQECIEVKRCCKPRPNCADYFFDRFVKELEEDDKMRKKIKTQSACKVARTFKKFDGYSSEPRDLNKPLPCGCKAVTCPPKPCPPLGPPSNPNCPPPVPIQCGSEGSGRNGGAKGYGTPNGNSYGGAKGNGTPNGNSYGEAKGNGGAKGYGAPNGNSYGGAKGNGGAGCNGNGNSGSRGNGNRNGGSAKVNRNTEPAWGTSPGQSTKNNKGFVDGASCAHDWPCK